LILNKKIKRGIFMFGQSGIVAWGTAELSGFLLERGTKLNKSQINIIKAATAFISGGATSAATYDAPGAALTVAISGYYVTDALNLPKNIIGPVKPLIDGLVEANGEKILDFFKDA
jgi:hypothetical protein